MSPLPFFAPSLFGIESAPLVYNENSGPRFVTSTITTGGSGSVNLQSATIQISDNYVAGEDVLAFTATDKISVEWQPGTGILLLSGSDSVENYQTALRSVSFENHSDNPAVTSRTISFQVGDGALYSVWSDRVIDIVANNDAPLLSDIEGSQLSYQQGARQVQVSNTVSVSDVDDGLLQSAVVRISDGTYVKNQDVLGFANTANITGSWDRSTGTLTLFGVDTVANYEQALRTVTYENTKVNPSAGLLNVQFSVSDGEFSSNSLTRVVNIGATNSAPVIDNTASSPLIYTENNDAVPIASGLTLHDTDNNSLVSAVIKISNYDAAQDRLYVADSGNIISSWNSATGELLLSGSDSVASYELLIQTATYQNISDDPVAEPRLIGIAAYDGLDWSGQSLLEVSVLPVNDAPTVSVPDSGVYIEGTVATVSPIVVTDVDDQELTGAVVRIIGNYQPTEDTLSFVDTANITGSWNATTGTLTLTGSDSPAAYAAALQQVSYSNNSENPSELVRTIEYTVSDGNAESDVAQTDLTVDAVNDAPIVMGMETSSLSYQENGAAVAITDALTISDVDDEFLEFAVIGITDGYIAQDDVLVFVDTPAISGYWDATLGVLTLTGTATPDNYQDAIRSVQYQNRNEAPAADPRTVTISVGDGEFNSAVVSRRIDIIAVNDAPLITGEPVQPFNYVENSDGINIFPTVSITDLDNDSMRSARISFTGEYVEGEDRLVVADRNNINSHWNVETGVLQLSGVATLSEYESAIRSVSYVNDSDNPSSSDRVVAVTVDDGRESSASIRAEVEVIAVNDAPSGTSGTVFIDEDRDHIFRPGDFGFTDEFEGHGFAAIKVYSAPEAGVLMLHNTPVDSGALVSLADIQSGSLIYRPPADVNGPAADRFYFRVQDNGGVANGGSDLDAVAKQMIVTIEPVNDAPFGSDTVVRGSEDLSLALGRDDFGFSDPADRHQFSAIIISSTPTSGALFVAGSLLTEGAVVAVEDIDRGLLTFRPEADQFGQQYASFDFKVVDDGGVEGGNDTAQQSNSVVIDIAAVNDPPQIQTRAFTLPEGGGRLIDPGTLNGIDADNPNPVDLTFTLTEPPENGALMVSGTVLTESQSFSLADIIGGNVFYRHDGSETSADRLVFSLSDNKSVAAIGSLAVIVQEVIDAAPLVENDTMKLQFGHSFDSGSGDVLESGSGVLGGQVDLGDNSELSISIETAPSHGVLELSADGRIFYQHDGSDVYVDEFSYRLTNEDGVYSIATVEIIIEPPVAEAGEATDTQDEFDTAGQGETVDTEETENATVEETTEEDSHAEPPRAAAFGLSPTAAQAEDADDDSNQVVKLDPVEVKSENFVSADDALEVKQHRKTAAPTVFVDDTSSEVVQALQLEFSFADARYGIANPKFLNELMRLESDLNDADSKARERLQLVNEVLLGATFSATAGVVVWIVRGGALFAGVMAVTPLWSTIDPSKLLKRKHKDSRADKVGDELESYFEKN